MSIYSVMGQSIENGESRCPPESENLVDNKGYEVGGGKWWRIKSDGQ